MGLVMGWVASKGSAGGNMGLDVCTEAAVASVPSRAYILGVAVGDCRNTADGMPAELDSCSLGDGDLLRKTAASTLRCCQATGADTKRCNVALGEY